MKNRFIAIFILPALLIAGRMVSSRRGDTQNTAQWKPLPSLAVSGGDFAQGVSAMYAGYAGDMTIVAGGANFPDVPVAEGGKKRFYDLIHIMRGAADGQAEWVQAGSLPEPAAYGASYQLADEIVIAGGANASGTLKTVYSLHPDGNGVIVEQTADLPFAVEQGGWAKSGSVLYLAGGLTDGRPSLAVLACDTQDCCRQWKVVATMPEAFVQPVLYVHGETLYIWGGFDPQSRAVADYGFRCDLTAGQWERIGGLPDGGTMTGSAAAVGADGTLYVAGGVNLEVFSGGLRRDASQMHEYLTHEPAWYRFNRMLWEFDQTTGEWSAMGTSEHSARAGASLVAADGGLILLGGETKPGIRTPDVLMLEL